MKKSRKNRDASIPATRPKKKGEIKAEYEALKALQKNVPHFLRTGEDNWEMIGAQIQTLEHDYTMAQIDHWWPDRTARSDGDNLGAAEDALFWKQGGDIPCPSEIWSLQVGKPEPDVVFTEDFMKKPRKIDG